MYSLQPLVRGASLRRVSAILGVLALTVPAPAQAYRARVSVKFIVNAAGSRPPGPWLQTDHQVLAAIQEANDILRASGAVWLFELTEIVDIADAVEYARPLSFSELATLLFLTTQEPDRFAFRSDAINVFIVDRSDSTGGVCGLPSSPQQNPLPCAIGSRNADWVDPTGATRWVGSTFLHEIGHFLGLCHTHGCGNDIPCEAGPEDDRVADTRTDHPCWSIDRVARENFGGPLAQLTAPEQREVAQTFFNVMSYHSEEKAASGKHFLTPGQLERIDLLSRSDDSVRRVVFQVGSDCNRNSIPDDVEISENADLDRNGDGIPDECGPGPEASILVARDSELEGATVVFDGSGSRAQAGHALVSYHWDFGDGSTASGPVASHAYETPGRFVVELSIEDDLRKQSSAAVIVDVQFRSSDVSPWLSGDIGAALALRGGSRLEDGCLRVAGTGTIGGLRTNDALRFTYQPMTGNFRLTASILSAADTAGADLGLMVRESLEPAARQACVVLRRLQDGLGRKLFWRDVEGTRLHLQDGETYAGAPVWLRLERVGDLLMASASPDGVVWSDPPDVVQLPGVARQVFTGVAATCVAASQSGADPCTSLICDLSLELLDEPPLEPTFRRGDTNADATGDMSDAIATLGFLFLGSQAPTCLDAADANDSGEVDLSDAVFTLGYLFLGTAAPPEPFGACGPDATADGLGCDAFEACR